MATFLDTTGGSYHLEQIIKGAAERLVLISPYLRTNDRIREFLDDRERLKIDIRVVYGKTDLAPDEMGWLRSKTGIRTSFCKNLHAKCYVNERVALITSMNLYRLLPQIKGQVGLRRVTRSAIYPSLATAMKMPAASGAAGGGARIGRWTPCEVAALFVQRAAAAQADQGCNSDSGSGVAVALINDRQRHPAKTHNPSSWEPTLQRRFRAASRACRALRYTRIPVNTPKAKATPQPLRSVRS